MRLYRFCRKGVTMCLVKKNHLLNYLPLSICLIAVAVGKPGFVEFARFLLELQCPLI